MGESVGESVDYRGAVEGEIMSEHGIDEEAGTIDVYAACPSEGDSVMIVNCGDHFEVRRHHRTSMLYLTDQDIDRMKQGHITWH